jgi:dipeptidase E
VAAVRTAEAVFIGGGNTFRLLKTLYDNQVKSSLLIKVVNSVLYDTN